MCDILPNRAERLWPCHLLQGRCDKKTISKRVRNFETKPNFRGFFLTIQVIHQHPGHQPHLDLGSQFVFLFLQLLVDLLDNGGNFVQGLSLGSVYLPVGAVEAVASMLMAGPLGNAYLLRRESPRPIWAAHSTEPMFSK